MKIRVYTDAGTFLRHTQAALESQEEANSLMLGVCGRLARQPVASRAAAYLATMADEDGLILAAMMTPPQKLVVYGHRSDVVEGARVLVQDLVRAGRSVPGVTGPGEAVRTVADAWADVTGGVYILEARRRIYVLRQVLTPVPQRGHLRPATEADVELVGRWWHAFNLDNFGQGDPEEAARDARLRVEQGDIYLWQDGLPVSMAMKNRPTRRGISVSLVYTPPELRRRGYATACVGELSRMLLQMGWEFCGLFADLDNPTANHIYQTIGYKPVCDYEAFAFL